jgi:hypothetical protein
MKKHVNLFKGFLMTLLCTMSLLANAGETFSYKKIFPSKALPETPSYITLNLYVTAEDTIPVASQTFFPDEWQLTTSSNAKILQVTMADISYLSDTPDLWAETEVDGQVVGSLEAISIIEPGISAGGIIESRTEGFKFPDTTVQTTAGVTPGDLATHQANSSAHHSPLVTTTEIVDDTILPVDLNQSENFIFSGMRNTGGDVNFWDTNHAMRWKDYEGANQRAFIHTYSDWWKFEHTLYSNRDILFSNADGIGIGTDAPVSTHAVTIPSLNVTGNLEVGLVKVSSVFSLSSTGTCHSHGNLTCFYGSGTVSCPVGTKVLGGGMTATSAARFGSIGQSYPSNDTSWTCGSSYDLASATRDCYAICARFE